MKPKRALIFSLAYYPNFVGGAEVAVKEITDRMDPEDFEFHMIALRTGDLLQEERIGSVVVHRVGFPAESGLLLALNKYLYPFAAARKGHRLQKEVGFDFAWSIMAGFSGFAALFWKLFNMNIPFLLTLQEGDPIDYIKNQSFKVKIGILKIPVKPLVYPLFKMIFANADRIQAISHHLADFGKSMVDGRFVRGRRRPERRRRRAFLPRGSA
jgi:hypothetical protein